MVCGRILTPQIDSRSLMSEELLMLAVLEQAFSDLLSGCPAIRADAEAYFLAYAADSSAFSLDAVRRGGLAGLDMNQEAHARHQAAYVDRVLRGGKPSELPVERSTKLEFVINLKTAKALGLTIPPSVLGRADHVIE